MARSPSFDAQASTFEDRAGLPPEAALEVAAAVTRLCPRRPLFEIGAGSGGLAREIAALHPAYLGCDLSLAMAAAFRRRSSATLVVADGDAPWPLRRASLGAVFASRSLHLITAPRVVEEVLRALGPVSGCVLLVGRVRRDPHSPPQRLRRTLHRILRRRGLLPRSPGRHLERVQEACCEAGARVIEPVIAAAWTDRGSPAEALAQWSRKAGLAGLDLPLREQHRALAEVAAWAAREWASPEKEMVWPTTYTLEGVRWP